MANSNPNMSGLVSLADRPSNERTKIQSSGGVASGISRREKMKMRQLLREALLLAQEDGQNTKEALAAALVNQALKGNVNAFVLIMKFVGEMPTELQQTTSDDEIDFLLGRLK